VKSVGWISLGERFRDGDGSGSLFGFWRPGRCLVVGFGNVGIVVTSPCNTSGLSRELASLCGDFDLKFDPFSRLEEELAVSSTAARLALAACAVNISSWSSGGFGLRRLGRIRE
jgi:hypothetical protein